MIVLGILLLWWDTVNRKQVGEERIYCLIVPHNISSLEEVKTGTQARMEPGSRTWFRGHGSMLLTGLLLLACSACLIIEFRTTNPGIAQSTMGWALSPCSLYGKCLTAGSRFLNWGFFLFDDSDLSQVDKQ